MKPEISVIITTYNRPVMLQRALDSVLAQTFKNFEVIIVDDHSDKPPDIKFPAKEKRVVAMRLPYNTGYQVRPKNIGIMIARGKYIAYLDDDNVYLPNHLEVLYEAIKKHQADVVYGDRVYKSTDKNEKRFMGKMSYPYDLNQLEHGNYIDTSDIMHTVQAINDIGFWDIFWERKGDWLLMTKFGKRGKKVVHVPEVITEYWWHGDNIGQFNPMGGEFPQSAEFRKNVRGLAQDLAKAKNVQFKARSAKDASPHMDKDARNPIGFKAQDGKWK